MKKSIALIIGVLFATALSAKHFWRGAVLSPSKVSEKWGQTSFGSKSFKEGDEKVRASMAYSILKNKKDFIGKSVADIREQFGTADGFYFADVFPAYMIQRGKSSSEESWQIVFLLDKERRVDDVIVHKNCCD